jgi:hypothetical protein
MPDSTISLLPAAVLPSAADLVPIVQAGVTKALTFQQLWSAGQMSSMGVRASLSGAKPNVQADQSLILQAAWNAAAALGVPFVVDGVFWIGANPHTAPDGLIRSIGLRIPSNSDCIFLPGAALKILPNNLQTFYGVDSYLSDNFSLWGAVVYGERNQHTGAAGEAGNCFNFVNCTNAYIHRPVAYDAWGDGIYLGVEFYAASNKQTRNVTLFEPRSYNARRNCFSVTSGIGLRVVRPYAESANGTAPQSGMDLEMESQGATVPVCDDWKILEPVTRNCLGSGISVYTNGVAANSTVDLEITGHHDKGSGCGAIFEHRDTAVSGQVRFLDPIWEGNQNNGLWCKSVTNGPRFVADNFLVKNCGNRAPQDWAYSSAVSAFRDVGQGTTVPGNYTLRGRVQDTNPQASKKCPFAFFTGDSATNPVNSLTITNAIVEILENSSTYPGRAKLTQNVDATCSLDLGGSGSFASNITRDFGSGNEFFTDVLMPDGSPANVTINLGAVRQPIKGLKMSKLYSMVFTPQAGSQIFPLTSAPGKGIYSNDPGASVNLYPSRGK